MAGKEQKRGLYSKSSDEADGGNDAELKKKQIWLIWNNVEVKLS